MHFVYTSGMQIKDGPILPGTQDLFNNYEGYFCGKTVKYHREK